MAYRNTIISLATLVAFGTACSKAPSYSSNVQSGAQPADLSPVAVDPGHGEPDPTAKPNTTPAPETKTADATPAASTTTPAAPAGNNAPPPAVVVRTEAEKAKIIAANGFVAYAVAAPNGQGWNTTATPFLIGQTVNAGGTIDTAKPVTVYFCNVQAGNMTMHSGDGANAGPMKHGNAFAGIPLAAGETVATKQAALDKLVFDTAVKADALKAITDQTNCKAHLITALGTATGATYNHQGGNANNAASFTYFKMYTVDTAGVAAVKQ